MSGLHLNPLERMQRHLHSDLLLEALSRELRQEGPSAQAHVPAEAEGQLQRLVSRIRALRRARQHAAAKMLPSFRS